MNVWLDWLNQKVMGGGIAGLPEQVNQHLAQYGINPKHSCKDCALLTTTTIHTKRKLITGEKYTVTEHTYQCGIAGADKNWSPDYPACGRWLAKEKKEKAKK